MASKFQWAPAKKLDLINGSHEVSPKNCKHTLQSGVAAMHAKGARAGKSAER